MKKNETKLLASRAVNKIGNVMYDYGNSTWIAGLGSIGQKYMGYYQLAENVISLFLNPIGGAVADRFKRRQILLVTDFIGGLMCAVLAFIGNDNIMLYGLIAVNAALAIMSAFSGTSFRSYVVTVVAEDRLVAFNSRLEVISQIVSIFPFFSASFFDSGGRKTYYNRKKEHKHQKYFAGHQRGNVFYCKGKGDFLSAGHRFNGKLFHRGV